MNCSNQIEYDREKYENQEIECPNCGKRMKVRPYKNGRVNFRNLYA
ncbi:hypothetical protein [Alkaliphilus sp. B6464]|nr:hypothetical protein [Alkaliphilus sp. B6464]QUH21826.1 hypothetical protein HYG84_17980 [Alkaliphilus sp. B6464]